MPQTSTRKLATTLTSLAITTAALSACSGDDDALAVETRFTRVGTATAGPSLAGPTAAGTATAGRSLAGPPVNGPVTAGPAGSATAGPAPAGPTTIGTTAGTSSTGGSAAGPAAVTGPLTAGTTPTASATTGSQAAPLTIFGSPAAFIAVEERYEFVPAVTAGSQAVTFSITSRPAWLTFDATHGRLSGTPTPADVGTYRGITISTTDGQRTQSLPPFDIDVVATGSRSATLAWQTPTNNEDGTVLDNLAGFKISYGRQTGHYSHSVDVTNPGVANYVVSGLVPGTYYFAMTAHNDYNVASTPSPEMTIVIR